MNENIDLTKILKNCPKETKLYSTVLGYVTVEKIKNNDVEYPIIVNCKNDVLDHFTANGKMLIDYEGECTLFPSKDQRDWSKFTAPWYKKEKFDPKTLKPFDKVIVRDDQLECWRCAFYSHQKKRKKDIIYRYATTTSSHVYCIPYNDDTKHLVGTTDEAPEYYKYWEG